MLPDKKELLKVVTFKTSRSGGKGGQNVNKVSSKVELILNLEDAWFLSPDEKVLLSEKLANKLDQDGNLHVVSQDDRSQLVNKENTIIKTIALLKSSLHVDKLRRVTHKPRRVIMKRKSDKMSISFKKENRKRPNLDA